MFEVSLRNGKGINDLDWDDNVISGTSAIKITLLWMNMLWFLTEVVKTMIGQLCDSVEAVSQINSNTLKVIHTVDYLIFINGCLGGKTLDLTQAQTHRDKQHAHQLATHGKQCYAE